MNMEKRKEIVAFLESVGLSEDIMQKGRQEGWQEGLEAEKRRTALAMLAKGMDVNTIAQITGLTEGEIAKIQRT